MRRLVEPACSLPRLSDVQAARGRWLSLLTPRPNGWRPGARPSGAAQRQSGVPSRQYYHASGTVVGAARQARGARIQRPGRALGFWPSGRARARLRARPRALAARSSRLSCIPDGVAGRRRPLSLPSDEDARRLSLPRAKPCASAAACGGNEPPPQRPAARRPVTALPRSQAPCVTVKKGEQGRAGRRESAARFCHALLGLPGDRLRRLHPHGGGAPARQLRLACFVSPVVR